MNHSHRAATQGEWQRQATHGRTARLVFFLLGLALIGYMVLYAHNSDQTVQRYLDQSHVIIK